MKFNQIILAIILVVVLVAVSGGLYTLDETEQAIVTQFGKPIGRAVEAPGLHFKIPLIHKANIFEKRWLEWDGDANQVPTRDKKYIWVDTYARWRIMNPLLFFQTVRDERGAQTRLDDIIDGETRNAIAHNNLIEIVRSSNRELSIEEGSREMIDTAALEKVKIGRDSVSGGILEKASKVALDYGIEIVDVRIKRINYSVNVRSKVYDRMISERLRIAEKYRSEGQGKSAEIKGRKEKELKRITSEAYKTAQELKGKADGEATKIYAAAYQKDPDFYAFTKTLETYKTTMDDKSWVILSTDSEFYKYLKRLR